MAFPLTAELGRFVERIRNEDIPAEVADKVCAAFVDTVGVMIAGRQEPAPQIVQAMLAPAGTEAMLVTGTGRASALDAAWINGTAAHALDYDDVAQQGGHPSAVLVPAILAEAEAIGASGADVIRAYAVGYEVFAELSRRDSDQHHEKGWHPTGIFGPIGAAAACAALRRLDAEKASMAIALSASQSSGLTANFGTMTKPFHAGRGAHSGLASARLAALGFTAGPDALEHRPGFLTAVSPKGRVDIDSPPAFKADGWAILDRNRLAVKKYPMCYCAHRALDGALDLKREKAIDAAKIDWVKVSLSPRNAQILLNHAPRTGLEAKFSIEFAMASTLGSGRAGLGELQDEFVLRPDVQALMKRVSVEEDPRDDPRRPGYAVHDRVQVGMKDGTVHDSGAIAQVRGDPELPLKVEDLKIKFTDCVEAGKAGINADRLYAALISLRQSADLKSLVACMQPG